MNERRPADEDHAPAIPRPARSNGARTYVEVRVRAPVALEEEVEAALFSLGAQGTSQSSLWDARANGRETGPAISDSERVPAAEDAIQVIGYFASESAPASERVNEAFARFPALRAHLADIVIECASRPYENWAERSRQALHSFRATSRLWIFPPWERVAGLSAGEDAIVIDPGQAFGVGSHATTRGCLELLDSWADERAARRPIAPSPRVNDAQAEVFEPQPRTPLRVLDVGTGTGVLALRAAQHVSRMEGGIVFAVDNDPEAVRSAARNLAWNRPPSSGSSASRTSIAQAQTAAPVLLFTGEAGAIRAGTAFDLILANLFLNPQLALREFFSNALPVAHHDATSGRNGQLILSGIRADDRGELVGSFGARGFRAIEEREASGWVALRFARP